MAGLVAAGTRGDLKILLTVNTAWNIANFRLNLIKSFQDECWEVITAAPEDDYAEILRLRGIRFYPIPIQNMGTNPFEDLKLCFTYWKLFKRERPDVLLSFTVKPNIYAGLAAKILVIPYFPNVAGLGTAFIKTNWITWIVKKLYRFALSGANTVFFQNIDDQSLFIQQSLVAPSKVQLLPGSGVDTTRFLPRQTPRSDNFTFLLPSRLLWDKGVGEFIEAAQMLRAKCKKARFQLLGFLGIENRSAISEEQVQHWVDMGIVEYLGSTDDVRPYLAMADCVVLPSYREGTPRALLEAAAMARPIITTDTVGCREVVDEGVNGYLCQPRDAKDLADKMVRVLQLNAQELEKMGLRGRDKMLREFDEQIVIERYMKVIREL